MVGVPGRSKGCKTCRRRKKGCDLKRPDCGSCTERGLVCDGYDLDRIFVDQSATMSRKTSKVKNEPKSREYSINFTRTGNIHTDKSSSELVHRNAKNSDYFTIVLPQSLARSAYSEKNVESYLDLYLPSVSLDRKLLLKHGLSSVVDSLYVKDDALRMSVVALTLAVVGQSNGHRAMMEEGKRLYSAALSEFAKALADVKRAGSEALLAVPRVLGMFEILFGSDSNLRIQARSWRSHAGGDMALMKAKGPRAFRTGVAHSLFLEGRLNPIIAAISTRTATSMNTKEWRTIPWEVNVKLPKDSLIDILAAVPELLEDQDKIAVCSGDERERHIRQLMEKCQKADAEMDAWIIANKNGFWEPEVEEPVPITFPDSLTAHLTVLYWTTCAILYEAIIDTNALLPMPPAFYLPPRQSNRKNPRPYAHYIVRALPYFFGPSAGIWSALMIAFPIGVALQIFNQRGSEEDDPYKAMVSRAWTDPSLPAAIQTFLASMLGEVERRDVRQRQERSSKIN